MTPRASRKALSGFNESHSFPISISKFTYRTLPVAHADIALDIEGGSPGEPERLHVGVDDSLVHGVPLRPGALELGDELVVLGTPEQWT